MIENNEFLLTLIRHGESEINATPDVVGQSPDVQLTSKGREQARKLRARFLHNKEKFDFVYSSTYDRALQTAHIAIPDSEQDIQKVYDLREYSAGEWTGGSREKLFTPEVKRQMNNFNLGFLPPGGESLHMVERRVSTWLEKELIFNPKMAGGKPLSIACFSHGQVIKSLLHYVAGFDKSFVWKIQINNTSLTRLYFDQDGWRLLSVNDSSHLEV
jgi:probable phosphoglycerate mutase